MSRRTHRSTLFSLTIAISSILAIGSAAAEDRFNTSGLQASQPVDGIIVQYRNGSIAKRDRNAMMRGLTVATSRAFGRNKGLRVRHVRTLGVGAELIGFNKSLDRVDTESLLRQIASDPNVLYVEPNLRAYPTLTPNDPHYANQYGFKSGVGGTNADQAWDTGHKGAGKIVAVIDTGYRPHGDLNANIINGFDFISNSWTANDGNGRDSDAKDPGDWVSAGACGAGQSARNSSWHGTHVAGTVAAVTNNGSGVAGMAHQSKVLAVRVLGRCGGSFADIADGITWASGGTVAGVPGVGSNKANVINLSLGGQSTCTSNSVIQQAINGAISRGVTVVVAAGNSSANVSGFTPAGCSGNGLIVVGATDSAGKQASFSNFGTGVDVSAPGVSIRSTLNSGTSGPVSDNYADYNGTSMAAPHVAGLVAMMQSKPSTDRTPAQAEALIKQNTKAFGATPAQPIGNGIIDAKKTINATP